MEDRSKKKFDLFFYQYLQIKFKLEKLVKKHCEEIILSVLKYSW